MKVSIVMTAYKRAGLLKNTLDSIFAQQFNDLEIIVVEDGYDGETEPLCNQYGVTYLCRRNRPDTPYSNPAIPTNMGIRAAQGEVLILQNAETKHVSPNLIRDLAERVTEDTAQFPRVESLNPDGTFEQWYLHEENQFGRKFFWCGAILLKHVIEIRGVDEDYLGACWDDNDLSDRLQAKGIKEVVNTDLLVQHQWHPRPEKQYETYEQNAAVFRSKQGKDFTIVRNQGREWGIDR